MRQSRGWNKKSIPSTAGKMRNNNNRQIWQYMLPGYDERVDNTGETTMPTAIYILGEYIDYIRNAEAEEEVKVKKKNAVGYDIVRAICGFGERCVWRKQYD